MNRQIRRTVVLRFQEDTPGLIDTPGQTRIVLVSGWPSLTRLNSVITLPTAVWSSRCRGGLTIENVNEAFEDC